MVMLENNKEMDDKYCKLKKYKISNLFDSKGNTPIYYACNKKNKKFIEEYSNYNFRNNQNEKINSFLFIETKNNCTPLEELYKKIKSNDNDILKLIIILTLELKKGYIFYLLEYLINNYKPIFYNIFKQQYKKNLLDSNYLVKIIGLYQYLTTELKYYIMIKDSKGNDPIFLAIIKNNFPFLFDILLSEKNKYILTMTSINNEGKSVVHLIVESKIIKNKNEILLKILNKGFAFDIKDNKGFSPIDYAFFNKEKEIIEILRNKYYNEGLPIIRNLKYNFYKDSDILYNDSILDSSNYQKFDDDLYSLVYKKFKYYGDKIHKVCVDNEGIPYNVSLLRGNFFYYKTINKYIIQIIENTKYNNFIVFTCQQENIINEYNFDKLNNAEIKFKELFKEKTNNDWDVIKKDKTKFKTNYIKYFYLDYGFEQENDIYDYLKQTINYLYIKKDITYNNVKVRDFIYYLTRKAYNNRFMNDNNDYNTYDFNKSIENNTREIIKKYKQKGIQDSLLILMKLEQLLKSSDIDKKKISYLENSYLELIPFSVHKNDTNIFKSLSDIKEEIGRLTTFYFIENIHKIFLGAIKNLDNIHPLDYIINSLGCDIIELIEKNEEKKYIKNFLFKGGAISIKNIFKIKVSINDINFNPNEFKNRYIFCHGTKVENILGILSQGLKISPVQAKHSGQSYGEGIYLSDSFNLSIHYSKKTELKNDRIFMLLVEAALGEEKKDYNVFKTNLDFKDVYMTEDGFGIFKLSKKIKYNGVIVIKDEMNVRIKYIIEI